jgi:lipopolysaccharide-induced tumor necrosis factor-alpha factor
MLSANNNTYAGPPPSYSQAQPMYAQPAQPVVVSGMPSQTYVVAGPAFMPRTPTMCVCPNCHAQIQTEVRVNPGICAWASCIGLCLLGCWLGCCLIPFAIPECQDVEHYCPNCHVLLGRRSAFN